MSSKIASFLFGIFALLGIGGAVYALAGSAGASDAIPQNSLAADISDPSISNAVDGITRFLDELKELSNAPELQQAAAYGAKDQVSQAYQRLYSWIEGVKTKIGAAGGESGSTLDTLDAKLDDLNGDGDTTNDVDGIPGVKVDLNVDFTKPDANKAFDATVTTKVVIDEKGPLAFLADGLKINGQDLGDKLQIDLSGKLHIDPMNATTAKKVTIAVPANPLGTVSLNLAATYPADKPLSFNLGLLGVTATGSLNGSAGLAVTLNDPNKDGVIDLAELANSTKLFTPTCTGTAKVDLTVNGSFAGLGAQVGSIKLDDPNICDGLAAPDVTLGDLAQFRNLSLGDLINGLAQVTQAIKSAQTAGDLDIPFVDKSVGALVDVNEKLVKFFVDNGFTDPANPLATITVDTAQATAIQSLQDLAPKLEQSLGLPAGSLSMRWSAGKILFTLKLAGDPAPANAGLDFGDTLKGNGITGFVGSATATVDTKYNLDLGFGFDLAAGLPLDQRFFLTNGTGNQIFTLDADVKADIDIQAVASIIGVQLKDSNASGAVTLLTRKDSTKPMLSVGLVDPNNDGRITLAEMANSVLNKTIPATATINATVPLTDLSVSENIAGVPVAAGKLSISWPTVPNVYPASDGLKVTADTTFENNLLPFAFDTSNPKALIGKILTVARDTVKQVRDAIAAGNATTSTPLPLVGKSVADLEPALAKVQTVLDKLVDSNDVSTLDSLQAKLNKVISDAIGKVDAPADLVSLTYVPKSGATNAAVVVNLHLGVCSTDRNKAGCTVTTPLNVPFNLSLGSGSKLGGVAGLGAEGEVNVSYDARANLTFGVELPSVVTNANPLQPPTVSGAPKLFVQDNSYLDLGFGLKASAVLHAGIGPVQADLGSAANKAQAQLAARFTIKAASPTGKRILAGPDFTAWVTSLLPRDGGLTVHETDPAYKPACSNLAAGESVDACAVLPVYVGGSTPLGSITFKAPDLLHPATWVPDAHEVVDALGNETIQFSLLVDGVRTLSEQLEKGLRNLPAGTKLPLIGSDVTAGADVIKKFRESVLDKVQSLSDQASSFLTVGNLKAKALELLNQIDVIKSGSTVAVTLTCKNDQGVVGTCADADPIGRLQSIEVNVPLHVGIEGASKPFDIGFPGLRLSSAGSVSGKAGLDLNLGFGIDRTIGFYIPTTGAAPEVALTASAALPNVDGKADLTGQLAFLPIEFEDQHPGDDVTVSAGLDLSTTRTDGRLPLADLATAVFKPSVHASATVQLGVTTTKPSSQVLSFLPTFHTDLKVNGSIDWTGSGSPTTTAGIKFDNVSVDAGSVVGDLIKPIAHDLHQYTQPLEKPIDAIRKPIPGVAEAAKLAGKTAPSWYDAFKALDDLTRKPGDPSGLQMIDRVIKLVDLIKALDASNLPAGQIPLGNFSVDTTLASSNLPIDDAGKLMTNAVPEAGDVLSKLNFQAKGQLDDATANGGLTFPAFKDPKQLFQLLLGKDVNLVYFDAGKLQVKRGFQFAYPIGPAKLYIGGSAEVNGHFAVGYDTYGLRQALAVLTDKDPTNDGFWDVTKGLLQGIFLDDNNQAGDDVPEIAFDAELTAGASVGIPGLSAGAEGGIHGHVDVNLHTDPEQNGKIRYTDIGKQIAINPNPLCFFDIAAKIDARIKAYVDSPFGKAEYPIVSKTLWEQKNLTEFCRTKVDQNPSLLATVQPDGTLVLKTDVTAEDWDLSVVDKTDTGFSVQISAKGIVETYKGVKRLATDLKGGDDRLDLHKANPELPDFTATVCGGAGNDRISVDSGIAQLYGDGGGAGCDPVTADDSGSDTLTGGPSDDTIDGGAKDDAIDGGAGNDTLTGGDDNDVITGGQGDDQIDGGAGDDTSDYRDHSTPVTLNPTGTSGSTGEADTATSVEIVYGGTNDDTANLPSSGSWIVDGSAGNDVVNLNKSTALAFGNDGNDTFNGGTGNAQLLGGAGDDTFVDGPGSQTFIGEDGTDTADYSKATKSVTVTVDGAPDDGPDGLAIDNVMDADVVIGGSANDHLTGGSKAEELRGGAGDDHLEGGPGNDTLLGGADKDLLEGNTGNDKLDGGAGDDTLRGGANADDFIGGADVDTADYADRTEALTITKNDAGDDGSAVDNWDDNVRTDVERIIGGSAGDTLIGYTGADTLDGRAGNDILYGMHGTDVLLGGDGNDSLYDVDFNGRFLTDDTGNDTFDGGAGTDTATGNGGNDTYTMGAGDDTVTAGPGDDAIHGNDGNDSIHGGDGKDVIDGDAGDDYLWGDNGDDLIRAGTGVTGNASIKGGLGNDTVYNADTGGSVTLGDTGVENTDGDTGPNTVYGYGGANNSYTGGNGADVFHLGDGNDNVHGLGGNDVIDAAGGNDQIRGDGGDDVVNAGDGKDGIYGGLGNDTLHGNGGDDIVEGDEGNDRLFGDEAHDSLVGNDGDDVMDGGTGSDIFDGGAGTDTVTYAGRTEPITVKDDGNASAGGASDRDPVYPTYLDSINQNVEVYIGGSGADSISLGSYTARTQPVRLEGGPGNDTLEIRSTFQQPATLVGGPGNDIETGGIGNDVFVQGTAPDGADVLTGGGGTDTVDYSKRPAGSTWITKDNLANDGAIGEGDNVRSDIESVPGASVPVTPAVSVGNVAVTEAGRATFTVSLSAATNHAVAVPWRTVNGTGIAGKDYVAASGTATVAAGARTTTFAVTTLTDPIDEANETVKVALGTPTGATLQVAAATLTIVDNDAPPKVSITSAVVTEGKPGARPLLKYTVRLSAASGKKITVKVTTANGTARAGSDYVARSATLTFNPGVTSQVFAVTVIGDSVREANETVKAVLSSPVNVVLGTATGIGTIRNDD